MQPYDIELLKSAQKLDAGSLARVYEEYSPAVFRYAFRLLGSLQNAEDCVADSFLGFLSAVEMRKGPKENLKAYLFRSAHNWIVDFYRKKSRQDIELADDFIDAFENVELEAENRIRVIETIKALDRLTIEQKEVVLLHYSEGLDNQAIAKIIHKTQGAVKALLHRAITSLQKELTYEK